MQVRFNKNGKVSITQLTMDEYCVIADLVRTTQGIMEWDEDTQSYTDHDNFLMSMDENEYKALQSMDF